MQLGPRSRSTRLRHEEDRPTSSCVSSLSLEQHTNRTTRTKSPAYTNHAKNHRGRWSSPRSLGSPPITTKEELRTETPLTASTSDSWTLGSSSLVSTGSGSVWNNLPLGSSSSMSMTAPAASASSSSSWWSPQHMQRQNRRILEGSHVYLDEDDDDDPDDVEEELDPEDHNEHHMERDEEERIPSPTALIPSLLSYSHPRRTRHLPSVPRPSSSSPPKQRRPKRRGECPEPDDTDTNELRYHRSCSPEQRRRVAQARRTRVQSGQACLRLEFRPQPWVVSQRPSTTSKDKDEPYSIPKEDTHYRNSNSNKHVVHSHWAPQQQQHDKNEEEEEEDSLQLVLNPTRSSSSLSHSLLAPSPELVVSSPVSLSNHHKSTQNHDDKLSERVVAPNDRTSRRFTHHPQDDRHHQSSSSSLRVDTSPTPQPTAAAAAARRNGSSSTKPISRDPVLYTKNHHNHKARTKSPDPPPSQQQVVAVPPPSNPAEPRPVPLQRTEQEAEQEKGSDKTILPTPKRLFSYRRRAKRERVQQRKSSRKDNHRHYKTASTHPPNTTDDTTINDTNGKTKRHRKTSVTRHSRRRSRSSTRSDTNPQDGTTTITTRTITTLTTTTTTTTSTRTSEEPNPTITTTPTTGADGLPGPNAVPNNNKETSLNQRGAGSRRFLWSSPTESASEDETRRGRSLSTNGTGAYKTRLEHRRKVLARQQQLCDGPHDDKAEMDDDNNKNSSLNNTTLDSTISSTSECPSDEHPHTDVSSFSSWEPDHHHPMQKTTTPSHADKTVTPIRSRSHMSLDNDPSKGTSDDTNVSLNIPALAAAATGDRTSNLFASAWTIKAAPAATIEFSEDDEDLRPAPDDHEAANGKNSEDISVWLDSSYEEDNPIQISSSGVQEEENKANSFQDCHRIQVTTQKPVVRPNLPGANLSTDSTPKHATKTDADSKPKDDTQKEEENSTYGAGCYKDTKESTVPFWPVLDISTMSLAQPGSSSQSPPGTTLGVNTDQVMSCFALKNNGEDEDDDEIVHHNYHPNESQKRAVLESPTKQSRTDASTGSSPVSPSNRSKLDHYIKEQANVDPIQELIEKVEDDASSAESTTVTSNTTDHSTSVAPMYDRRRDRRRKRLERQRHEQQQKKHPLEKSRSMSSIHSCGSVHTAASSMITFMSPERQTLTVVSSPQRHKDEESQFVIMEDDDEEDDDGGGATTCSDDDSIASSTRAAAPYPCSAPQLDPDSTSTQNRHAQETHDSMDPISAAICAPDSPLTPKRNRFSWLSLAKRLTACSVGPTWSSSLSYYCSDPTSEGSPPTTMSPPKATLATPLPPPPLPAAPQVTEQHRDNKTKNRDLMDTNNNKNRKKLTLDERNKSTPNHKKRNLLTGLGARRRRQRQQQQQQKQQRLQAITVVTPPPTPPRSFGSVPVALESPTPSYGKPPRPGRSVGGTWMMKKKRSSSTLATTAQSPPRAALVRSRRPNDTTTTNVPLLQSASSLSSSSSTRPVRFPHKSHPPALGLYQSLSSGSDNESSSSSSCCASDKDGERNSTLDDYTLSHIRGMKKQQQEKKRHKETIDGPSSLSSSTPPWLTTFPTRSSSNSNWRSSLGGTHRIPHHPGFRGMDP